MNVFWTSSSPFEIGTVHEARLRSRFAGILTPLLENGMVYVFYGASPRGRIRNPFKIPVPNGIQVGLDGRDLVIAGLHLEEVEAFATKRIQHDPFEPMTGIGLYRVDRMFVASLHLGPRGLRTSPWIYKILASRGGTRSLPMINQGLGCSYIDVDRSISVLLPVPRGIFPVMRGNRIVMASQNHHYVAGFMTRVVMSAPISAFTGFGIFPASHYVIVDHQSQRSPEFID